jgi:hypothetical protein
MFVLRIKKRRGLVLPPANHNGRIIIFSPQPHHLGQSSPSIPLVSNQSKPFKHQPKRRYSRHVICGVIIGYLAEYSPVKMHQSINCGRFKNTSAVLFHPHTHTHIHAGRERERERETPRLHNTIEPAPRGCQKRKEHWV